MWATASVSITMQLEYNAVMLVVNYVAKIHRFCKCFLHKKVHIKIFFRFSKSTPVKLNP